MPSEWDEDTQEILVLRPAERVRRWRWWFLLLVLLGMLAAGYSIYRALQEAASKPASGASQSELYRYPVRLASLGIDVAAFDKNQTSERRSTADPLRPYIMPGVFIFLALVTFLSLMVTLFSSDEKRTKTASDITKIGLGFFIGVGSNYF